MAPILRKHRTVRGRRRSDAVEDLEQSNALRHKGLADQAGTAAISALRTLARLQPQEPELRFDALEACARAHCSSASLATASRCSTRMGFLATQLGRPHLHSRSLITEATLLWCLDKLPTCLEKLAEALEWARSGRNDALELQCLGLLAVVNAQWGLDLESSAYETDLLSLTGHVHTNATNASTLCVRSECALERGDFDQALDFARRGLKEDASRVERPTIQQLLRLRGEAEIALGFYKESLMSFTRSRLLLARNDLAGQILELRIAAACLACDRNTERLRRQVQALRPMQCKEAVIKARLLELAWLFHGDLEKADTAQEQLIELLRSIEDGKRHRTFTLLKRLELLPNRTLRLIGTHGKITVSPLERRFIDEQSYELFYDGATGSLHVRHKEPVSLELSSMPGQLLAHFLRSPELSFSRQKIYESVWKTPFYREYNDNDVYVMLSKLRLLIGDRDRSPQLLRLNKDGYSFTGACRWGFIEPLA